MVTASALSRPSIKAILNGALCLAFCVPVCAESPPPLASVADLRLGVALYHHYQQQPLEALSELLVAKAKGGIKGHGNNPDIMMGGFYLAYGMENTAQQTFETYLSDAQPSEQKDAAWYALAQLHYQRSDWAATETALSRISATPEPTLAQDILTLRSQLFMRQNQPEKAQGLIKQIDSENPWLPYLYYNLGAAYGRQNQFKDAIPAFNRVRFLFKPNQAFLALHDKAMTGAGYSYLMLKNYDEAISQFSRVRLDTPYANRALLGYGWAAVENGQFVQALTPWAKLIEQNPMDESVQEGFVALPYAYEQLKRLPDALAAYTHAEAKLTKALADIENTPKSFSNDTLNALLSETTPTAPPFGQDYAYLAPLLASEDFTQLTQTLRDLLQQQRSLQQWQTKLSLYQQLLKNKEIQRQRTLSQYPQQATMAQLASLQTQKEQLQNQLTVAKTSGDPRLLLDGKAADYTQRLQQAQSQFNALNAAGLAPSVTGLKLRLLSGMHLWQAQDQAAANLYQLESGLNEITQRIKTLQRIWQSVQGQMAQFEDLQAQQQRLNTQQHLLQQHLQAINLALTQAKNTLNAQLASNLNSQKTHISAQLAQTRLNIARLLDQAQVEKR